MNFGTPNSVSKNEISQKSMYLQQYLFLGFFLYLKIQIKKNGVKYLKSYRFGIHLMVIFHGLCNTEVVRYFFLIKYKIYFFFQTRNKLKFKIDFIMILVLVSAYNYCLHLFIYRWTTFRLNSKSTFWSTKDFLKKRLQKNLKFSENLKKMKFFFKQETNSKPMIVSLLF